MSEYVFRFVLSLLIVANLSLPVQAKVSKQEADRLKSDLTPTGAERAGNADGTITAWTGGLTATPEGVNFDEASFNPKNGGKYPDPFANEKPLFVITVQNMDQYADKLTEGVKGMLKRYPDTFKLNVYPTHRTFAAPQWVYDNTYQNALRGETSEDNMAASNVLGGYPFPIPQNGTQAIFNHLLRWQGLDETHSFTSGIVYADGKYVEGGVQIGRYKRVYYDRDQTLDSFDGGYARILYEYISPARRKGEIAAGWFIMDSRKNRPSWQYSPGSRRVRRAPNVGYDTPNPSFGNTATYDDSLMYNGNIDRYDFKLIGKKEMFIPYNAYKVDLATSLEDLLLPGHLSPKYARWELHRVWVVEGKVKKGSRHIYPRRVFHIDEDSWQNVLEDKYDSRDNLWRYTEGHHLMEWLHQPHPVSVGFLSYDFQTDIYGAGELFMEGSYRYHSAIPMDYATPANMRKLGKR